jgi:hypothetical protein
MYTVTLKNKTPTKFKHIVFHVFSGTKSVTLRKEDKHIIISADYTKSEVQQKLELN